MKMSRNAPEAGCKKEKRPEWIGALGKTFS
jgi:hypothetical protein